MLVLKVIGRKTGLKEIWRINRSLNTVNSGGSLKLKTIDWSTVRSALRAPGPEGGFRIGGIIAQGCNRLSTTVITLDVHLYQIDDLGRGGN